MAYARVYSTRFIAAVGLNGEQPVTVPAGSVAVLRSVDVYYGGGIDTQRFYLIGSAGQTIWEYTSNSTDGEAFHWRGRQVFNPGEDMTFRSTSAMDVTASGYLLEAIE